MFKNLLALAFLLMCVNAFPHQEENKTGQAISKLFV
jgi:hypothetical protein